MPKDVRERILNHGGKRKGSITESVYNRYEYDAEKRAALDLWADALDGIIGGRPTEIRGYSPKDASWLLIGIGGFGFCLGWILWQSNIVTFLRWTFATLLIALDAVCFRTYHLLLPFTLALIMWFASVTAGRELHVLASSTARLKPSSQTAQ